MKEYFTAMSFKAFEYIKDQNLRNKLETDFKV